LQGGGSLQNTEIVDLHFGYCANPGITYISSVILFAGILQFCTLFKNIFVLWLGMHTMELMGLQIGTGIISSIVIKFLFKFNLHINSIYISSLCLVIFFLIAIVLTILMQKKNAMDAIY